jgi:DNA-binding CsgD family transcriptional regulator
LGEVVIDPKLWVDVMDDICAAVGATGAGLLQAETRTTDVPVSAGGKEIFAAYFANNLHIRDLRAQRAGPHLARGASVLIDEDLVTPDDIKRDPGYANLIAHGFQWFGGVIFKSDSDIWALTIQRTIKEGPFSHDDKRLLAALCRPLSEAATLSAAIGQATLASTTNALNDMRQAAIAIDRGGFVLASNTAAEMIFDDTIGVRNGQLYVADRDASRQFLGIFERINAAPDIAPLPINPVVIRRPAKPLVIARLLPVPPLARSPFLGARAMITLTPAVARPGPDMQLLMNVFRLTAAEAKLASLIAEGISPEAAAKTLDIAPATARTQLKAIFAKTATHRQSELVALLGRL